MSSEGYNTASAASGAATTTANSDSGVAADAVVGAGPLTMHTSPRPERKRVSPGGGGDGDGREGFERPRETLIRNYSPQAYKFFMEQRVENVMKEYEQRRQRRMRLEKELLQCSSQLDPVMHEQMRQVLQRKETNYLRMKRAKLNKRHFKKIKKIGAGAFGDVFLVRSNAGVGTRTGALYAMKTLKKNNVIKQNQVAHVIAERDALREADNDWIVKLFYSFQVHTDSIHTPRQSSILSYVMFINGLMLAGL